MDQKAYEDIFRKNSSKNMENVKRQNKKNKDRKYKQKKNLRKKIVTAGVAALALNQLSAMNVGILANTTYELYKGANIIAHEFEQYTEGYKIIPIAGGGNYIADPDGFSIATFKTGEYVTLESAYPLMIKEYQEAEGADLGTTWVAVDEVLGTEAANKYVGEVSKEEINAAKENALNKQKVEEYGKGGISK